MRRQESPIWWDDAELDELQYVTQCRPHYNPYSVSQHSRREHRALLVKLVPLDASSLTLSQKGS